MDRYERIRWKIERDKALFLIVFGIFMIVMGIVELAMFNELAQIFAT
jgi:hypothetical protein